LSEIERTVRGGVIPIYVNLENLGSDTIVDFKVGGFQAIHGFYPL